MKHIALTLFIALLLTSCGTTSNNYNQQVTEYKMTWGGYERLYLVHLPPEGQRSGPMPVLFNIHGGGGTARGNIGLTFGRFNELSDRDGFMVVYPEAVDKNWNDGRQIEGAKAWEENIDDVGFIAAIIEKLEGQYNIDTDRIFTTGMSNGGFMSSRLLCDRADLFRGGAVLTATLAADYLPQCHPEKPVGLLLMNGTADPLVPYDGGQVKVFRKTRGTIASTDDYIDFWREKNGCNAKANRTRLPDEEDDGTAVIIDTYGGCEEGGALQLYRIEGGGHTWPGGKQYLGKKLIGLTSQEINACEVIWDFFKTL